MFFCDVENRIFKNGLTGNRFFCWCSILCFLCRLFCSMVVSVLTSGYHTEFKFTYCKTMSGMLMVFIYALYDMSMELVAMDSYTDRAAREDINIYS